MSYIQMSDEAYEEFKAFLDSTNIDNYDLKVIYMGRNCSGATFNLDTSGYEPNDIVEQVKDIKFFMSEELLEEYGGFIILSNNENKGQGLEFKPVNLINNCSACPQLGC
ncbi:HesB-like protein [Clostridium sp. DJ247]|uniref:HesB-like protein n=1 Tax=Clostridium sp. DJ247 TaxID=2726188 RepID=UPI00162488CD|nr:HesB-like protein [Clostridium sp. DJ247]MBC2578725.1 HesB-like protein [Clostridium sp. DJ247]